MQSGKDSTSDSIETFMPDTTSLAATGAWLRRKVLCISSERATRVGRSDHVISKVAFSSRRRCLPG